MKLADSRPPLLWRRLLAWAARRLDASEIVEDAEEIFLERVRRGGERSARRWYRRQARAALARVVVPWRERPGASTGWSAGLSLDARLGVRMLVRYPGLTLVGVLALAVGIGFGAAWLEVVHDVYHPDVPLPEGDQVVGIETRDVAASVPELRSLYDFLRWRQSLESVRGLGAFRTVERNLVASPQGGAEPVEVAEISPSAFALARVPPFLGRTLLEADARAGAPDVLVLGYDTWRRRFGADPAVVGRTVRLGAARPTVVGVMPEGFAFPMNHGLWTPLRPGELAPGGPEPRQGPSLRVFGRLSPGVTLEEARAEVASSGARMAADHPDTHRFLRPRVVPYTHLFFGGDGGSGLYLFEVVFVMLLVLVAANVATLVFARTATRSTEIAVRSALGASHVRIVGQLTAEALVLSLAAAVVALAVVRWLLGWVAGVFWTGLGSPAPFWWDDGLSPGTVLGALALAGVGAVVVGVLPAMKAARGRARDALAGAGAGGTALRLGRFWMGMLVVQVAASVALLPLGVDLVWRVLQTEAPDPGFPAAEYLSARIEADRTEASGAPAPRDASPEGFRTTLQELRRRVESEPGVRGVTFARAFPGMTHPRRPIEVEGMEPPRHGEGRVGIHIGEPGEWSADWPVAEVAFVDADFFDVLGVRVVAGRGLPSADAEDAGDAAVVNRAFTEEVLGGRNPVGRRVRYALGAEEERGAWWTVVGVVEDLATDQQGLDSGKRPALYRSLWWRAGPEAGAYSARAGDEEDYAVGAGMVSIGHVGEVVEGDRYTVRMAVHLRGAPGTFAPRLRELAMDVEPALRVKDLLPLDTPPAMARGVRSLNELIGWAVAAIVLTVLLVSAAGTYSLMSFTVAQRTREIGIRSALGANPGRLVGEIFAGALRRLVLGVVLGGLAWLVPMAWLASVQSAPTDYARAVGVLVAVGAIVLGVALLACGIPAKRALSIEPTEALRGGS